MTSNTKNTLYLTDFPFSSKVTEKDIFSFLSDYTPSIREVKFDKKSYEKRKSISFKVSFKDYSSANKCRLEMNLVKYKNKSIRIMWDEHDTDILYNTKNNLFFKGIPKNISPRTVYEYFSNFGDISSCKMTEDDNGNHYGYGYITFYSQDAAKEALDNTKDKQLEAFDNNYIEISFFQKKNERNLQKKDIHSLNKQKLYITNLPEKYTTSDLCNLCKQYGSLQSCNIFYDNNNNKNFGIVQFSSEKEAKDLLVKLDKKEINNTKLSVQLYQSKLEQKKNNLYIKNIPLNCEEKDLIKIFSKYGKITSAKIETYKKGDITISKGFGYISFENPESAEKAKDELDGKYLPGFESWSHPLMIEFFLSNQERQNLNINNDFSTLNYFYYNDKDIMNETSSNTNSVYMNQNFGNNNNCNNIFSSNSTPTIFNFNNINININEYKKPLQLSAGFSDEAKDLITKLLDLDPKKRIGAGPNGVEDLKKHPYFKGIDWKELENKNVKAPFVPDLNGEMDLKYFDKMFTDEVNITRESDELNETNKTIDNYVNFSYYDPTNASFKDKNKIIIPLKNNKKKK